MNSSSRHVFASIEELSLIADERAIAQGQLAYSKDLPAKATEVDRP